MRAVVVPTFVYMSLPILTALERFAEDGVDFVELHGDAPDTHIDLTDERLVDSIAEAVRDLPLEIHSVHCAFSQPSEEAWDISQPDDDRRAAAVRNRMKVIQATARLGAHHVVVHPGAGHCGDDALALSRTSLGQLAESAQQAGTKMAVENLPPDQLGGSLPEMVRLLDGLDPMVVGFCLDTGHAMLGKDSVADYIRTLGDRLLGIHWHGNNHRDDTHTFPDIAEAQWGDFFAALDEVGYDLPVTLEAVPPPGMSLPDALQPLRSVLAGTPAR